MARLLTAAVMCALVLASLSVQAGQFTFTPSDADLAELPHDYWYKWGVRWTLPTNEVVTSATLTYKSIWDWTKETNHLYTHLLDTVTDTNGSFSPNWTNKLGYQTITISGVDNEGGGDKFLGQGILLGDWSDPVGGYDRHFNLVYEIPTANYSWLEDGNFGIAIDPDCHYYNCGVELKITTGAPSIVPTVPEASTIMLALMGATSLGGIRFLRRK